MNYAGMHYDILDEFAAAQQQARAAGLDLRKGFGFQILQFSRSTGVGRGRPARMIKDQNGTLYRGGEEVEAKTGVKKKTVWKILRGERSSSAGFSFSWA